jgi:Flp pilus assembly protein TadG
MATAAEPSQPRRATRDRGVAVVLVAVMLFPLLLFAAYGVDLAAWHSRVTYLQKAADAAATAGAVWMPNLSKATLVANESLDQNKIVSGVGGMVVTISEGVTATSLRVTVSDHSADRYLSSVVNGRRVLTRSAEAEYFLPLPLGSPLNYFGGDRSKTQLADTTSYVVSWPTPPMGASRPTVGPTYPCNVGTSSAQVLGRWTSATVYDSAGYTGSTQCQWTAVGSAGAGTTAVPPPDHTTRTPTTQPCLVRANGSATGTVQGRWNANVYTPGTTGTNAMCTFTTYTTTASTVPSFSATTAPLNRPCNVGYEAAHGKWPTTGAFLPDSIYTAADTAGNRLCRWHPAISTVVTAGANPIAVTRNPGFWAQVEGPGTVGALGDAFSARCTTTLSCATQQSVQYRDTGYWYVIKMPATGASATTVSIFDALFRRDGTITTKTGDALTYGSTSTTTNPTFTTEYRVYRQTNAVDINVRTPVGTASSANQTDNSCWWNITAEVAFDMQWKPLCTITPANGETYLLNVKTHNTGTQGVGLNGYAVEAISVGTLQPALYAYSDMGTFNNGSGTFYLTEVGPEFAGKVLAIDLWDPGDVSSGTATIYPKMPSASAPKPVADAPATCTFTASPDPNAVNAGTPAWGVTGTRYPTAQASDSTTRCAINTAPAGTTQRFNDEWLRIRIQIPAAYTCTKGLNPETTAGSCWWGIEYAFSAQPYDVTTWKARIEGNPVHVTR